jgi:protein-disulfide isomerase
MNRDSLAIPAAIVIAAALIAGAIYLKGDTANQNNVAIPSPEDIAENNTPEVPPISENDHVRGNPNADIVIIEYSDYDCPFCKNFHETMNQVMDTYGVDGRVAWVYRHFPIPRLHPNAVKIAEGSECVAELGGKDAFWTYSDLVYGERGVNDPTDMSRLPEFAAAAGVDEGEFELCLNSGKYTDQIMSDIQAAVDAGGQGTPHNVIVVGDQEGAINGAQPFDVMSQIIENLIAQIDGETQQ